MITLADLREEVQQEIHRQKILLDQAQRKLDKAQKKLYSTRKAKKKLGQSPINEGRLRMSHNRKHRMKQVRAIKQVQDIGKTKKAIQMATDQAEFDYNLSKSQFNEVLTEFSIPIMRITGLLDSFYDNYFVKTKKVIL